MKHVFVQKWVAFFSQVMANLRGEIWKNDGQLQLKPSSLGYRPLFFYTKHHRHRWDEVKSGAQNSEMLVHDFR